jgi:phage gp29-like protein
VKYQGGSSEAVYGLGLIGAWVYYISRATTVQEGVVGFLKGLVWPAFLVYELFEFLHKEKPAA